MVGRGVVAAASRLATPHGWRSAGQQRPGDVVWAVGRDGQLREVCVVAITKPVDTDLTCAFTRVGDLLAPQEAMLAGATGPVPAAELTTGPNLLEAVTPGDLPAGKQRPQPLAGLAGTTFTVPEELAEVAALEAALVRAKIAYAPTEAAGWVAIRVEATGEAHDWTWAKELELLEALTAWPDGEEVVRRTRADQREIRGRLIEALMETRSYYELRWVPAYFPVEARIARSEASAPAFTGVTALRKLRGAAVELQVEQATALVCDGLFLRLRTSK